MTSFIDAILTLLKAGVFLNCFCHMLCCYQHFRKDTIVFCPKNWNIKLDTLVIDYHTRALEQHLQTLTVFSKPHLSQIAQTTRIWE